MDRVGIKKRKKNGADILCHRYVYEIATIGDFCDVCSINNIVSRPQDKNIRDKWHCETPPVYQMVQ